MYSRMDPYQRPKKSRNPLYDEGIDAKVVIMGNTGVGKTSLLHRYTANKFDPKNTTSTTGAFFVTKKVFVDGIKVRLQLWDTAGQERFRSMAPMYYRGANAALLMYDITNASTFEDIRGWLEELKKNCGSDLIIYIVGSKADLHRHRQVTSDLARLSLHTWFPPPQPLPPPLPPQPSTLSYIRPRFTSFPAILSHTPASPVKPPPETLPYLDLHPSRLNRNNTTVITRPKIPGGSGLGRLNTTTADLRSPLQSRFGSHFGSQAGGWSEIVEARSTLKQVEEDTATEEDQEWGLHKGMELFEVSAKDDSGIQNLFDSLISAIIVRKDVIEQENELKKRDSIFLSSSTPTWAAQAEEEEAREKAQRSAGSWSCC